MTPEGRCVVESRWTKLAWSLPWLVRYPRWQAGEWIHRLTDRTGIQHLIIVVANHFEPAWNSSGIALDSAKQQARVDEWCQAAREIGEAVRDHDGRPFRHTNFYPAEQYDRSLLTRLAELQAAGFGEVEIHLHHGVRGRDTADNTRKTLVEFRDVLAEEHKCLARAEGCATPRYAFVHGNWALANSAAGRYCGVDSEMQILAETGCYADFTLPSAPHVGQVPRVNAIYQCGRPLYERAPHRSGPSVRVGDRPILPLILTGPLVFDWSRRRYGLPVPRLETGALTARAPMDVTRLERWRRARIGVVGRPEWVFIKLFCHGFFDHDRPATIGWKMKRFLSEVLELAEQTRRFTLHFASARESFNIALAALDGHTGQPGTYRDYQLRQIMRSGRSARPGNHDVALPVKSVS
jgi:hypothetical protein